MAAANFATAKPISVAGRLLKPTLVFDTYWRFASERQSIYQARLRGETGPWSTDSILSRFRFTNCFRASDRVSQFLIQRVAYAGDQSPTEIVFRTLLFKFFNRVDTWELLEHEIETLTWSTFDFERYDRVLSDAFAAGRRIYSAAYVIPPPSFGEVRKHTNHLRLLQFMMTDGVTKRLADAQDMADAFKILRSYPSMGDFLAFQMLIDLNYSTVLSFDEMDHVVAGPGAKDGIRKCFGAASKGIETEIIRYMAESQTEHFERLGLRFEGLQGRALHLIDCQNVFCEVDKYARVAHPEIQGLSGRSRIKQTFAPDAERLTSWFPPKWGLMCGTRPIE
jgi:hypothetical protein